MARPAAGVLTVAVASLAIGLGGNEFGLHERVVAFLTVVWPLVTAVSTWWWAGHRVGSRRVRHVLAVVGLVIACGAAGTSATAIAPATAQTRHYQASVALDPNPLNSGELVATTAFGDLRLEFQGIAPGIRAVPQVKANIAEVLSRPGVSLASLRPGPEELSTAIRDVAVPSWSASRSVRSPSSPSCSPGTPCSADAARPRRWSWPGSSAGSRRRSSPASRSSRRTNPTVRRRSPRRGCSARSSATRASSATSRAERPRWRPTCATSSPCRRPCSRSTRRRPWSPTPRCACCSSATSTPATSTT